MLRIAAGFLFILFMGAAAGPAAGADEPAGQRSVEEIGKIIREYLLNNPEVIFEAARIHQERQRQQQVQRDRDAVKKHRAQLLANPHTVVGGNPDGDVTLVEFFDYQCGYCKRFAPTLEKIKKQDAKLRVVYVEFPILGPDSIRAAQAALAARNQKRYIEFHEALMRVNGKLDEKTLMTVARSVGLDTERLRQDMETPAILNMVSDNGRLAQALNITGTPALIVGDQIARGAVPLEQLTAMIAKARAKGS